jgi:AraC-like DNA-binding protein
VSGVAGTQSGMDATATEKGILDPGTAERVHLDRWLPSPATAQIVERFWTLRFEVPSPQVQPLLPHPCVNIAFGTADPGVHGPPRLRDDHRIAGRGWVLGAKLRPGALVAMGLGDGPALVDAVLPVDAVFGQAGRAVADVISADPDADPDADLRARSALVEELLQRYLPIADETWPDFIDVIATILADRTLVRVSQVAKVSGWSARTLQRWFGHYLGLSPAWVLARYRLQDAAEVLAGAEQVDLAQLSAELGYYDQAHFTRAFTSAVGMPPGTYARWCRDRLAEPVKRLAG